MPTMKERAARARKLRIEAANRLINAQHIILHTHQKKQKQRVRHLVPPAELQVVVS